MGESCLQKTKKEKSEGGFRTQIDPTSATFQQNAKAMQAAVDDFKKKLAFSEAGGGKVARERHHQHGKLLPRERIKLLLDPDADFLELSILAGYEMYDDALSYSYEYLNNMFRVYTKSEEFQILIDNLNLYSYIQCKMCNTGLINKF